MTRRIDCNGEGCEECQMCRYLNFLEWAGQVAGGVPSTIQRNPKLDARIAAQAMEARQGGGADAVHDSAVRQDAPDTSIHPTTGGEA